eukprot:5518032-Heterocapsa_arctica.AAC.1
MAEAEEEEDISMDDIRSIWRTLAGSQNPADATLIMLIGHAAGTALRAQAGRAAGTGSTGP